MINVIFNFPDLNYQTEKIPMPFVPSIRDQVFCSNFLTEEDQDYLFTLDNQIELDYFLVAGVAWMRNSEEKEIYVTITLTNE